MRKATTRSVWAPVVMALVVSTAGCAQKGSAGSRSIMRGLTTSNGLAQNGLTTNGIWSNGIWSNGIWSNGIWSNGIWSNGIWSNGIWSNGIWSNGIWSNGIWSNGIWSNGIWSNGITGTEAVPGQVLRSSPYARQLLQYIYSCAMPAATYDTTIDPYLPDSMPCSTAASGGPHCDAGYECIENKCVIPLRGAGANGSGLGINADGTTWWETGKCDKSCQRWVSACVLARTNAYGVHVQISMRAPANAPPAIKKALAPSPGQDGNPSETTLFSKPEGAYYGNIFETVPVPSTPPAPGYSGPATGAIAMTPTYTACAGPESNTPQLTKRFESSQGDQVVISVPGVCLATASDPGTCAGSDTDPHSPTYGSVQHCYTSPNLTSTTACATVTGPGGVAEPGDPNCYDEVITVFLADPIAVCGNGVCEPPAETTDCCPTDCHPATWAKDFSPLLETGSAYQAPACSAASSATGTCPTAPRIQFSPNAMSALAADGSVAIVGDASVDICPDGACPLSLGDATLPASAGKGILVKYNADGSEAWPAGAVRFGNSPPISSVSPLQSVSGVIVGSNPNSAATSPDHTGNITVTGVATKVGTSHQQIWVSSFQPDGTPLGTWIPQLVGNPTLAPFGGTLAFDSQSNLVMAVKAGSSTTASLANVTSMAVGGGGTLCALLAGGTVDCWGAGNVGQLGNGTNSEISPYAVPVPGLSGATAIAAGDLYNCALLPGGAVKCWGYNPYGQLGNGTKVGSSLPVGVSDLTGAIAISAGFSHTCALMTGGGVKCWGQNLSGSLGNGTTTDSTTPVDVTGLAGAATAIGTGSSYSCALLSGGTVQCWGENGNASLGNGTTTDSSVPVTVSGVTGASALAVGSFTACAIVSGGAIKCWGDNRGGKLGNGSTTGPQTCLGSNPCSTSPVDVVGLSRPATAIAAQAFANCALLSDGTVQCWGRNDGGQLGIGTETGPQTCGSVACSSTAVAVKGLAGPVTAIAAGGDNACAILSGGTVQCWGANTVGEVGYGGRCNCNIDTPTAVAQPSFFVVKTSLPSGVPDAAVVWAASIEGTGSLTIDFAQSLSIDRNDNVVVVTADTFGGQTQGNVHRICADGGALAGLGCPDGSSAWAKTNSNYSAVAFDDVGNVYASGIAYSSSRTVGTPFVQKFDPGGNSLWPTTANSSTAVCPFLGSSQAASCMSNPPVQGVSMGFDGGHNIVLASFGNPAVGGGISFGPPGVFPTFPMYGAPHIFLSAYDPNTGNVQWAKQIETILSGSLHGMALGNQGQIVVAGNYSGSMLVDNQLLVTASPQSPSVVDSFLASFAEPAPLIPTIGQGSTCGGAPFNTRPSDIYVPATSPAGACVFFMPPTSTWATAVTCSPPPNTTFPIGSTPVTCTAWDAYGHSASTDPFTVNVINPAPPTFTNVPAPITRIVTGPTAITYAAPTVVDQLDNPASCSSCAGPATSGGPLGPPPPCAPPRVTATCTPASGSTFPLGTTTVSCTTSDSAGRTATATFDVTLIPQVTAHCVGASGAPVALPTAPGTCGVEVSNASTIAGTCGGALLEVCTFDGQVSETLRPGNYAIPVVGTAVDLTTTASCTSYVKVIDANKPSLTLPLDTITAIGNTASGAAVRYSASASDICDGAVVPTCSAPSGATFPFGSTPVTCTATDAQGNSTSGSFLVQVNYSWSGVLQPINADGTSIFKLGSTVPVKFQLTGASAGITSAVATLTLAKISSSVEGTYVEAVSTSAATSGNLFRYDGGQYIFNLSTKGLSTGTWSLSINLGDRVPRTVNISLR
jgi:alpha-tubulin suppressor-like RCC1 family protein